MSSMFRAMTLDDSPARLEQSYRLRYQVYCLERQFLPGVRLSGPRLEIDEFDRDSVHVGVSTATAISPGPLASSGGNPGVAVVPSLHPVSARDHLRPT